MRVPPRRRRGAPEDLLDYADHVLDRLRLPRRGALLAERKAAEAQVAHLGLQQHHVLNVLAVESDAAW